MRRSFFNDDRRSGARMFRLGSAIALGALILAPSAVLAAGPSAPASSIRDLAVALVEADGSKEKFAKGLQPLERMLGQSIASKVGASDPAEAGKVKATLHSALESLPAKMADTAADAYAANFSRRELSDILAFMNGPGGRAEIANLPLLKADLAAGMSQETSGVVKVGEDAFVQAPAARRALILRLFNAQDLEAHTRLGYAALEHVMTAALTAADDDQATRKTQRAETASPLEAEKEARAADEYVRMVMAVEKRFYVNHFSDEELTLLVAYLESDAGQAIIARNSLVQRAVVQGMQEHLGAILSSLDAQVCATVPCTSKQRADLKDFARSMSVVFGSVKDIPL